MPEDIRASAIRALLFDYVKSPSLRHIRDPHSISKLGQEIMRVVDRGDPYWRKWEGRREALLRAASTCWVPLEDLRDFLNQMPGSTLTLTDVGQRMRTMHEEEYGPCPNEELQADCLAIYHREQQLGTELPAIVGALQEFVEAEEYRRHAEQQAALRRKQEEDRAALEQRFLSGADCKWTPINRSAAYYARINGRAYRLSPTKDKRWTLDRIEAVDDVGAVVGVYRYRGDANKVLAKLAYEPEPRY